VSLSSFVALQCLELDVRLVLVTGLLEGILGCMTKIYSILALKNSTKNTGRRHSLILVEE
jgi:hypothetical protein